MLTLQEKYKQEVIPAMMKKFGYKSSMAVPRIEKVVINTGFGRQVAGKSAEEQKKISEAIAVELGVISGQKAVLTKAKKSIASFKIREGMFIGAKVTLRGKRMNDFLMRLVHIVLPRTRDFQGIELKSFDKKGNLNLAVKEHIAFPEIIPERAKDIFGLEITVVNNAVRREEGIELLKLLGFPIKKE